MLQKIVNILIFVLFNSSFAFCQEITLTPQEVNKIYKKGHQYFKNADFENSLKTLRVALYHSLIIKNDTLTAEIYNRVARNFAELSEEEQALSYFEKSLFYSKKSHDIDSQIMVLINIGNTYTSYNKKDFKTSNKYYNNALALSEKVKDSASMAIIYLNLSWSFFENNKYDEGYPYLLNLNKYNPKFGDITSNATVAMLNGMYWSHKNDTKKAKYFFEKGVNIKKKIELKDDMQYLYLYYSEFLNKIGEHQEAYNYLVKHNQIKQNLFNTNKLKKANIAGINFEMDEFKRELIKAQADKKIQDDKLKSSKTISYLLLGFVLIFGMLVFMFYKNSINKSKSNKKLAISNKQLQEAKEVAEEASKVKSQFVSTITHELRTPLYGVIGMTDILQDEHKELEDNPHLKSLKFSAQYLLSLVNDILKINKLEENNTTLESNTIHLKSEIESIINSLSFLATKNKNKLSYTIDKSIPESLIGDKLHLTQILINLIGNALKFTKNGEVSVEFLLNKIVDKSYYIEFKIKDNGLGIAKEDQHKIFEKFVQVNSNDVDYQGTGLGLSIVKKLLDLHQSEIKLESTIGIGTTFSFIIAFEDELEKVDQLFDENSISSKLYKILVVEDNKINQVVTRKIIEKNSGTCQVANDGFEALSILENQTFDVILMDINMPGIDGYETSKRIRATGNKTIIIALTASSKDQIKEKVLSSGMNDIIVKPFETKVLLQTIIRNST